VSNALHYFNINIRLLISISIIKTDKQNKMSEKVIFKNNLIADNFRTIDPSLSILSSVMIVLSDDCKKHLRICESSVFMN